MIYSNILETIGNTPSIEIRNININDTNIYIKAEFFNPASSIKDRLAISIIENAESNGLLKKGQTIVEATSGNTGIGLAMVCASKNYPLVVTMPDSASIERRKLMRFLGAKVLLTPASEGGTGAYKKAKNLVDKNKWFFARQFENEDNPAIHENTTAVEIYEDFNEIGLDYWISGYGTGGTFTGVSRYLREKMPTTKLILTEPDVAQLVGKGKKQKRNEDGSASDSHPDWNPHPIQGWTTDFIPKVLQESIDNKYFDELIPVSGNDGIHWANELAKKEGIITGVSGGSTFAIAVDVAKRAAPNSNILCMLPDSAERYMSSILFDHIDSEMNDDEIQILNSC
jgi:cysteine synthase A